WDLPRTAGIEVTLLPGVTDAGGAALLRAAEQLGVSAVGAATGRRIELGADVTAERADTILRRVVANPIVERWTEGHAEPTMHADTGASGLAEVVAIAGRPLDVLVKIGEERSLALDPEELLAIQAHFAELGREPT